MTVIAFDGKQLAADKQMTYGMTRHTVTKIFRFDDKLIAITGHASAGMETLQWYKNGAKPEDYPNGNRPGDEGGASLIVFEKHKPVLKYERGPHPFALEGDFCAFGCGDESAMIAMELGATAKLAVELVSKYNNGCGMGVDTLEFE